MARWAHQHIGAWAELGVSARARWHVCERARWCVGVMACVGAMVRWHVGMDVSADSARWCSALVCQGVDASGHWCVGASWRWRISVFTLAR